MRARDPRIDPVLQKAYAYAVFPDAGRRGVLFAHGVPRGHVKLEPSRAANEQAEVLVLRDQEQVDRLERGALDLGATAAAPVFVMPARGGDVHQTDTSIASERIELEPAG